MAAKRLKLVTEVVHITEVIDKLVLYNIERFRDSSEFGTLVNWLTLT